MGLRLKVFLGTVIVCSLFKVIQVLFKFEPAEAFP